MACGSTLVLMAWAEEGEGHRHLRSLGGKALRLRLRVQGRGREGVQRMNGMLELQRLSSCRHTRTQPSHYRKLGCRKLEEHRDCCWCLPTARAYRDHMPTGKDYMGCKAFGMQRSAQPARHMERN